MVNMLTHIPHTYIHEHTLHAQASSTIHLHSTEILYQIDKLVFQQATLVQLLLPLSSVWYQLGEQRTIIRTLKELGAVRLANALAHFIYSNNRMYKDMIKVDV